jgi:hypothetical protein
VGPLTHALDRERLDRDEPRAASEAQIRRVNRRLPAGSQIMVSITLQVIASPMVDGIVTADNVRA